MPRDYAKYRSRSPQKLVEKGWLKRLWVLALVVCVVGILIVGGWFYKKNAHEPLSQRFSDWAMQFRAHFSHKKIGASSLSAKASSVQEGKQEPEVRFNFYTELPKMQVTLSDASEAQSASTAPRQLSPVASTKEAATSAVEPKKEPKKSQYILQLGVFQNETDAGQLRVSLLLSGLEADTVTSSAEGGQSVTYRVQKGPFQSLSEVKELQKKLQKKGIIGTIKPL